jgi:hypothetical protein
MSQEVVNYDLKEIFEVVDPLFQIAKYKNQQLISRKGRIKKLSVADPGCLSRIPDPDFYSSWIPDLGSRNQKQQQKRGVKKLVSYIFL